MPKIYPSLIAANQLFLHDAITHLEPYCAGFHCDVMDDHFVPNLTFGSDTVNAIDAATKTQTWVHLMVDNPIAWCDRLSLKEDSIVSFHFESTKKINDIIKRIKEKNWNASIAINPKTQADEIFPYLKLVDQALIMSVEPGFSGQRFLEPTLDKIAPLIDYRKKNNLSFTIAIDGGINAENISMIAHKGIEDFAIASAIFDQPNPIASLALLSEKIK